MQHARVVACLVRRDSGFLVDDDQPQARVSTLKGASRGQPHDPGANHRDIRSVAHYRPLPTR
jgi:hypothetical protein